MFEYNFSIVMIFEFPLDFTQAVYVFSLAPFEFVDIVLVFVRELALGASA